jgi:hypothetical protein
MLGSGFDLNVKIYCVTDTVISTTQEENRESTRLDQDGSF